MNRPGYPWYAQSLDALSGLRPVVGKPLSRPLPEPCGRTWAVFGRGEATEQAPLGPQTPETGRME